MDRRTRFGGDALWSQRSEARARRESRRVMRLESLEDRLALHASLVISEVMYLAPAPSDTELSVLGNATSSDFEFVELTNPSATEPLVLRDMQLTGDIQFVFPDEQLAPGESAIVAARPSAMAARYGGALRVLGQWQGSLSDEVPRVTVIDDDLHDVVDLQLGGNALWPMAANGLGASLELIDPTTTLPSQMSKPSRWQASFRFGGTPGNVRSTGSGVVINEVLASLDPNAVVTDQIELLNMSSVATDISGWYVGNSPSNPLQFALPAGTILAAGEMLVLDSSQFNPTPESPGPNDFVLDAVHGDPLFLTIADDNGGVARIEDSVQLGPSDGASWGRDSASDNLFTVLRAPTFGAANAGAAIGPAIISEVHFQPGPPAPSALQIDPTLTADDLEYVEVYNGSLSGLDLSGWRLGGVVDFGFVPGTQLASHETIVVVSFDPQSPAMTTRLEAFRQHYGIDPSARMVGPYVGPQPNGHGQMTLLQPGLPPDAEPEFTPLYLRDVARYDNISPWPAETDGGGLSLDRLSIDVSGLIAGGWAARQPTPGSVSFVPPPQPLLPDLAIWDDPLLGLNYLDFLDVDPRTGRRIMRFSTAVNNVGAGPLIVQASDVAGGTQQVVQVVENDDGTTTEYDAGEYLFHPTHGHVHFAGYAMYRLYEVDEDGTNGEVGGVGPQVAGGEKVSFCLLDSAPFDFELPGAPQLPVFASCEQQTQGISVGWADIYASDVDDQWIDIEDVPSGEYWFETIIDPFDNLLESDETNNVVRHKVVLGVPQYEPDSLDAAGINEQRLGTGDKQVSQLSIHRPGDVDTFRWVASETGTLDVDLAFDRSLGDIDLYVWGTDDDGNVELMSSTTDGNGENLSVPVTGGETYFVVVKELSGDTNPSYDLTLDGPDILPDVLEPNDDVLQLQVLGQGNQTLEDLTIHSPTDRDFFSWTAPESATMVVDLQFNSAQGNLDLFVHDFTTNQVAKSRSNIGRELLEVEVQQGQTYVIIVQGRDGDMVSDYDLTVDLLDIPLDDYEPNDAKDEPFKLDAGDQDLGGLSVHKPFNRDFFRWQAPADGPTVVDLLFAQSDGDLDLIYWENGESIEMSGSNTDNEQLTLNASAGHTYLFEIVGKNGAVNPLYQLTIDGPESTADDYEPNDSPATATDLGKGDVDSVVANVHESFNADFYLWTPAGAGVVVVDLLFQQVEGDLDLILWSDGQQVDASLSSDDNERLFLFVEEDKAYVLEVRGNSGDISPQYELRIDSPELAADSLEPNDALAGAVDLGLGDVLLTGMNVHESGNNDFYRWSPAATGRAVIDLRFSHEDGDLDLALWIDDIETNLSDAQVDNEQLSIDVSFGQQYTIEVRGKDGAVNPHYELQIESPEAPRVTSVDVAKASVADQWRSLVSSEQDGVTIPWLDWQMIQVGFSTDVVVQATDLVVTGVLGEPHELTDFRYDATLRLATWTLVNAPVAEELTLTLSDAVADTSLNSLDGELTIVQLPSGDGLPGGPLVLIVDVLPGDFRADGNLDEGDIDALAAAIRAEDSLFDLSGDGRSTTDDLIVLVQDLMGTTIGDVNLDGRFDSSDLVVLFAIGQFEDDIVGNSTWVTGDLNGDSEFDSSDMLFAFQIGGYDS